MNILIVGNGFDLSHYLPTKYDHFMDVMQSIQNFPPHSGSMRFEDIFENSLKKEFPFFQKTLEFHKHDNLVLTSNTIQEILNTNIWYNFFLDHVNEIKTWIDFEQKIEEALLLVVSALNTIEDYFLKNGKFDLGIIKNKRPSDKLYYFPELQFHLLEKLGLFCSIQNKTNLEPDGRLCPDFFKVNMNEKYGFDSKKYLSFLQKQLDNFIELFNLYLTDIIDKFQKNTDFKIKNFIEVNEIYSFNYTNTFEKFYNNEIKINYLHGRHGANQNLVLGISDLNHSSLIGLKVYGFTKYHQKLLKNTDYIFLHDRLTNYRHDKKELDNAISLLRANIGDNGIRNEIKTNVDFKRINLSSMNLFFIFGDIL